jgi:mRNA interferase MazF
MVTLAAGDVVLVAFPFSDLTAAKLRPAAVLADVGIGDFVMCQITSNPYGDARAVGLRDEDFDHGSLRRQSYARPGKLFTGNRSLIKVSIGRLKQVKFRALVDEVIKLISGSS